MYKEVQKNLTSISEAVRLTPLALNALSLKFMEKGWIPAGYHLSVDQIGTTALARILQDAKEFWVFVDMMKHTAGMDIIADILKCMFTNSYLYPSLPF